MADVFMSYSREDRARAEQLANALSAHGWSVWWDRKIAAGATFDKIIEQELDSAKCVLVLWSGTSVQSEWVKNEAAAALEREVLIPVLIDNARLPIEFRRRQTVDLVGWDGSAASPALQSLIEGVAHRLNDTSRLPPAAPPPTPMRKRSPRMAWSAAAAAVVLIAGAVAWKNLGPDETDSVTPPQVSDGAEPPVNASAEPVVDAITYAMTCRGGGPFEVRRESTGGVRVGFVPGDQPASPSLLPGQCSWSDRTLSAEEPREICDATDGRSRFVDALARAETLTVQVYFEPATNCFRVVRF